MFRWTLSEAPLWFQPIDIVQTATLSSLQIFFIFFPLSISSSLFRSLQSLSRHLSAFPRVTFVTFNISCLQERVLFFQSLEKQKKSSSYKAQSTRMNKIKTKLCACKLPSSKVKRCASSFSLGFLSSLKVLQICEPAVPPAGCTAWSPLLVFLPLSQLLPQGTYFKKI